MTNLGGLKLAEGGGIAGNWSKGGGVGVEDLHGVVTGGAEVRTVIHHKVKIQDNSNVVQFHGGVQFVDVIILDGVLEHGS